MLITTPITPAAASYYFLGQPAGRWTGRGAAALGIGGPVDRRTLATLLQGCHPVDGRFLPARQPARRRAGWDLTLAAPKSVSLLCARAGNDAGYIAGAHVAAVDEVVGHFERRLLAVRRSTAPGGRVPAEGLVAAAFDHRINASGEPHLHTHLIVCNLGRDGDGRWSALHTGWWTERAAMSAIYQMGLRHHLGQGGLALEWRLRDDGFAEVIGVPRTAVRVSSGRSRAAAATRRGFGEKAGRMVGIRAAATARGRWSPAGAGGPGTGTASGFGTEEAARLVGEARRGAIGDACPGLEDAVAARLAGQRSSFRAADVLVALAACTPGGLAAVAAEQWVARFCAAARPVVGETGQAPRWTTGLAQAADERLWACARRAANRDGTHLTLSGEEHPGVSPQAISAAQELVAGSQGMHILGAPAGRTNLLAHAAVLEVAARVWEAAGHRVVVASCDVQAAQRWQVLTGIDRREPGRVADVVVVDHADRRPTPELLSLLRDIEHSGARAVLVEGGTRPRMTWRYSAALASIGEGLGRVDPGPAPVWTGDPELSGGPVRASSPTAADAVRHLLASWVEAGSSPDPGVLVGLGYAEVDGLNQAARGILIAHARIGGPALIAGGRVFQRGDQALALRRLAADLPPGTSLCVEEIDPRRNAATVTWDGRAKVLDRAALAHAGYGYAVTPPLAAGTLRPLMVLGPAESMGPHRGRVVAAAHVRSDAGRALRPAVGLDTGSPGIAGPGMA